MRLLSTGPRAALLLPALFLGSPALAQQKAKRATTTAAATDNDGDDDAATDTGLPALETAKADASTTAAAAASTTAATNKASTVEVPKTTNAATSTPAATDKSAATTKSAEDPTTLSEDPSKTTGTNTVSQKLADKTITGGADATSGGLTGLPTLPATSVAIPVAQIPPTANAPYMQASSLPAGTVFIAVGAILGFFFICVLLWRGLTVWALKRNMRRAAERQKSSGAAGDTKQLLHFRRPDVPLGAAGYRENRDSMLSLGRMPGGRSAAARPATAGSAQGHASSLFFSPTAQGAGGLQPNRGSTYLPSGYYAAGSAAPGNGSGMTHLGGGGNNISLSNLGGPPTQGYSRARSLAGETPPESPSHRAVDGGRDRLAPGGMGQGFSTSTLDLSQRPGGRAPSAYLEEMFDEAGAVPGSYPVNDSRHPGYGGGSGRI